MFEMRGSHALPPSPGPGVWGEPVLKQLSIGGRRFIAFGLVWLMLSFHRRSVGGGGGEKGGENKKKTIL